MFFLTLKTLYIVHEISAHHCSPCVPVPGFGLLIRLLNVKAALRLKKKKIGLICEQSFTSENEKSCLNFAVLRLVLVAAPYHSGQYEF